MQASIRSALNSSCRPRDRSSCRRSATRPPRVPTACASRASSRRRHAAWRPTTSVSWARRAARRAPPTEVTLANGDGGELKLSVSDEVRLRAGEGLFRPALLLADGGELRVSDALEPLQERDAISLSCCTV